MKLFVITNTYRMLNFFINKYAETLEPIIVDKKNIIKISTIWDMRGRIKKDSKIIYLEDFRDINNRYFDKIFKYLDNIGHVDGLEFHTLSCDHDLLKKHLIK